MTSKDGFAWTPEHGGQQGIPTISVIKPSQYRVPSEEDVLDVIVLGAGYCGLVATRDLATQGKKVLLIEARDRIGGRTWHSTIDGFNYEMGGTWVHWQMPHIYREMSLYGLNNDWIVSQTPGGPLDFCTLAMNGKQQNLSHEVELKMFSKTWSTFCNLDGSYMTEGMPYPFASMSNLELMTRFDKISCKDRLDELRPQFSQEEAGMLEAVLLQMGGGPLDQMGLLDALRWYALGGHRPTGLNDIALSTRLKSGQSALARKIFDHAVSTQRLSYTFSSPVSKVEDLGNYTTVTTRAGQTYKAPHVICTIPLNVLGSIDFVPALPVQARAAVAAGQTNKCNKIHYDIAGPDLVSWSSFATPGKGLICALSDNLTPANDTHLVAFGPSPQLPVGISLKDNVAGIKAAIDHLLPDKREIKRIVYHDWANDEYAKGTWCYLPPGWASKYLEIMQTPHGNVILASADWSDGWRGWIDGAVEAGMHAAKKVLDNLGDVQGLTPLFSSVVRP